MSNNVTLSLPLSATALRLGATLLTDLAAQTETIHAELTGMNPFYRPSTSVGEMTLDVSVNTDKLQAQLGAIEGAANADEVIAALTDSVEITTLEQDVATAEAETPEQRQFRLHGNVASAGMEPVITQETLPPVEYETVVTGYAPGPTPFADGHDQASYEAAGWSIEPLLNAGHLVEVTEQRPKEGVPSVSAAPSPSTLAPAPAPVAPAATGVQLDKDGLPWDSRIHSDAAEKLTKTGVWKTRKNLPDGYKAQIEAELKAVMAAGKPSGVALTPTPSGSTSASATTPVAPAADPNVSQNTTTTVAAVAPPAPSAPAAPAPAPASGVAPAAPATNPFATFTRWILDHKLSATDVVLEVQKLGLTSIPDLGKRHDLIPTVVAALQAKGLGL